MAKKREKGFIALTSVLIIGAIVIILGVSLFHSALTNYSISTAFESGQQAAFLADFCLKEGVLKIQEDINYIGGEEIGLGNATCTINVKHIDENTKEISSLGRAGEQLHFSRASQLVRYIIEPGEGGWDSVESENLEMTEEGFLRLEGFEEIVILNSTTSESCDTLCQQEAGYQCISVGTDAEAASNGDMWTAFQENEEYSCLLIEEANCESIMSDYSQELPDGCEGQTPAWTYCKCMQGKTEGYRISPEFNLSSGTGETVKDSRIFWRADERFDGNIDVKVNVLTDGEWIYDQEVVNGGQIPGLEPGTNLSGAKIQTKTSFVGGPNFYPSLENIKIFLDLE